ncbi:MAG: head decoration protein [Beijerinckiaceae bacterium]|nr:head decoration protein [Beijerinckiaceae bacterium]
MALDTKTMGPRDLSFILSEVGPISRDTVTILSGSGVLDPGTVLGRVTASGKFKPVTAAAEDPATGADVALAVLAYGVDATSADVKAVVVRRLAEVKTSMLVWGVDFDNDAKKQAAIVELAAVNIIAR